jgi:hypothetical protein
MKRNYLISERLLSSLQKRGERCFSVALPLVLGLLGCAALAAHRPSSDVDENGKSEGDQEEDSHAERVSGKDLGDTVKAVLGRSAA